MATHLVLHRVVFGWPSGLRRWFKAPVSSGAWVRIPLRTPFCSNNESAIGLVVKYLVANEVPRVRFPDGASRSCGAVGSASVLCADGPGFEPLQEHFLRPQRIVFNAIKDTKLTSYAHTMVKPPDPIRTPKLSTIGPAQYCGGGPRGNRRWCTFLLSQAE